MKNHDLAEVWGFAGMGFGFFLIWCLCSGLVLLSPYLPNNSANQHPAAVTKTK